MFAKMLQANGMRSGVVYATGIMKAREVIRMAADFRAQETIHPMTDRILRENEKAALAGDFDGTALEINFTFSIPASVQVGKEAGYLG